MRGEYTLMGLHLSYSPHGALCRGDPFQTYFGMGFS